MAGRHVHVIATTDAGTMCALKTASRLAADRAAGLILVVPCEVSFAPGGATPSTYVADTADAYRQLAAAVGVDPIVRICLCRRRNEVFERLLIAQAEVVVGGRRRRWWPTREERLARCLETAGHHVTFAAIEAGGTAPVRDARAFARPSSV